MKRNNISRNIEAYEAIKELLVSCKLFPGQKIIYRDLEAKLGMSKTPIINGLIKLEQEGLVVSERNRGFYIKDVSPDDAEQIFDLRQRLEEISIDYAISNYEKEDLALLKEKLIAYNEYSFHIYDKKRAKLDTEFHMQIARMGKNEFFTFIIGQFYENIHFKLNVFFLSAYIDQFGQEHELLYEAIKEKDRKSAKRILMVHNREAKRLLIEGLRS
jgi:DNA-binding GntR family transcriptional regulator